MNLISLKRRVGVVVDVWGRLSRIDAAQEAADKSEQELANAREAEKRAADRATQAAKTYSAVEAAAIAEETRLAGFNPLAAVAERS